VTSPPDRLTRLRLTRSVYCECKFEGRMLPNSTPFTIARYRDIVRQILPPRLALCLQECHCPFGAMIAAKAMVSDRLAEERLCHV
jgi:hypothetical protein